MLWWQLEKKITQLHLFAKKIFFKIMQQKNPTKQVKFFNVLSSL